MPTEADPDKEYEVELALQYNDGYHENVFTFVNNINTIECGTHLVGFRTALTRALNNWARTEKVLKDKDPVPAGEDFKEGIAASAARRDPVFKGR
jgi:DNA gyrase subunit B